ncbi:MAG: BPTI/Kunitz-type proteinase inhibitor domain-containing protein [Candidatus Marinimicrobia bacterium]|nr:BPTI/Kunitz-type proteinase inhibitor domain-containing protein [Candidatus Neomarinimicrobiota bacterium]
MDDACYLIPETGPCEALITRYYYDQDANICSKFTWGGCQGVVPFETMEECKRSCGE